jgi:uncharacterized protein (DUF427 family)
VVPVRLSASSGHFSADGHRRRLPGPGIACQTGRAGLGALRSRRRVRASLEGITLAESVTPVPVFETGLPTRYYFDRTDVAFGQLAVTGTQTACAYEGVTSSYWGGHR